MWSYVNRILYLVENAIVHMEMRHWAIAATVMLVVGFVCMKGLSGKTSI